MSATLRERQGTGRGQGQVDSRMTRRGPTRPVRRVSAPIAALPDIRSRLQPVVQRVVQRCCASRCSNSDVGGVGGEPRRGLSEVGANHPCIVQGRVRQRESGAMRRRTWGRRSSPAQLGARQQPEAKTSESRLSRTCWRNHGVRTRRQRTHAHAHGLHAGGPTDCAADAAHGERCTANPLTRKTTARMPHRLAGNGPGGARLGACSEEPNAELGLVDESVKGETGRLSDRHWVRDFMSDTQRDRGLSRSEAAAMVPSHRAYSMLDPGAKGDPVQRTRVRRASVEATSVPEGDGANTSPHGPHCAGVCETERYVPVECPRTRILCAAAARDMRSEIEVAWDGQQRKPARDGPSASPGSP